MSTMTIHPSATLPRGTVRLTRRGRLVVLLAARGLTGTDHVDGRESK